MPALVFHPHIQYLVTHWLLWLWAETRGGRWTRPTWCDPSPNYPFEVTTKRAAWYSEHILMSLNFREKKKKRKKERKSVQRWKERCLEKVPGKQMRNGKICSELQLRRLVVSELCICSQEVTVTKLLRKLLLLYEFYTSLYFCSTVFQRKILIHSPHLFGSILKKHIMNKWVNSVCFGSWLLVIGPLVTFQMSVSCWKHFIITIIKTIIVSKTLVHSFFSSQFYIQ